MNIPALDAQTTHDTPYGSVGVLHAGDDLHAWWIWKLGEEVDPVLTTCDREDLIYVVRGKLKLELPDRTILLDVGDVFVIPAHTAFRGYRWPRDGDEPCLFLAVTPADAELVRA